MSRQVTRSLWLIPALALLAMAVPARGDGPVEGRSAWSVLTPALQAMAGLEPDSALDPVASTTDPEHELAAAAGPAAKRPLFVTATGSNRVAVLNVRIKSKKVKAKTGRRIRVGAKPMGIAAYPPGDAEVVLTANFGDDTVSRIDAAVQEVTATIDVGRRPQDVVITPDGRYAFTANFGSNDVSVIDLDTDQVINTVRARRRPKHLAMDPDGEFVLVATEKKKFLTVVDVAEATDQAAPSPSGPATSRLRVGCRPGAAFAIRFEVSFSGRDVQGLHRGASCPGDDEFVFESSGFGGLFGGNDSMVHDQVGYPPYHLSPPPRCGPTCVDGAALTMSPASGDGERRALALVDARDGEEVRYFFENLPEGHQGQRVLRLRGPDNSGSSVGQDGNIDIPGDNAFFGVPLTEVEDGGGSYFFLVYSPRRARVLWTKQVSIPRIEEPFDSAF